MTRLNECFKWENSAAVNKNANIYFCHEVWQDQGRVGYCFRWYQPWVYTREVENYLKAYSIYILQVWVKDQMYSEKLGFLSLIFSSFSWYSSSSLLSVILHRQLPGWQSSSCQYSCLCLWVDREKFQHFILAWSHAESCPPKSMASPRI